MWPWWIAAVTVAGCAASPPGFPAVDGTSGGPPDPVTTNEPDVESSTREPGDSSSGSGSSAGDEGTTASTSGGSTDGSGDATETDGTSDPYPACPSQQDEECGEGQACIAFYDVAKSSVGGTICGATDCNRSECPMPRSGNAEAICTKVPPAGACLLHCAGPCPDGMACMKTTYGALCLWP